MIEKKSKVHKAYFDKLQKKLFAMEKLYKGPAGSERSLCAGTACEDRILCDKGRLPWSKCQMRHAWLTTFAIKAHEVMEAGTVVTDGSMLAGIHVRDVLGDLWHEGLDKTGKAVVADALDRTLNYGSELALLYFIVQRNYKLNGVDEEQVAYFMTYPGPFAFKARFFSDLLGGKVPAQPSAWKRYAAGVAATAMVGMLAYASYR